MGCSGSKEEVSEPTSRPARIETPIPEREDDHKTSTKTFDTHTTEASSYLGFRGPSFQSLPSTTGSNPRSEGGSDIGSISIFSASSKRSGGFGVGEKLSELSDEEGFEEDFEEDFEDDEDGSGRGGGGGGGGGGGRAGERPAPLSAAGAAPASASRYDAVGLAAATKLLRQVARSGVEVAPFNLPRVRASPITGFPSCVPRCKSSSALFVFFTLARALFFRNGESLLIGPKTRNF